MITARLLLVVAAILPIVACESTPEREDGSSDGRSPRSTGLAAANSGASEEARAMKVRDVRIMCYDATTERVTHLFVNESNSKLKTEKGRLELTGGNKRLGIETYHDAAIAELLLQFEQRNVNILKRPWRTGDERLFRLTRRENRNYKGVILVEYNGQRYKLLAQRPWTPDHARAFAEAKSLLLYWNNHLPRRTRYTSSIAPDANPFGTRN